MKTENRQMSFRPSEEIRELIQLASEATGATQDHIISECIRTGVAGVVDEILNNNGRSLEAFRKAAKRHAR